MMDRKTDGRTDARGKTIRLPTLKGGDIKKSPNLHVAVYTDSESMLEIRNDMGLY